MQLRRARFISAVVLAAAILLVVSNHAFGLLAQNERRPEYDLIASRLERIEQRLHFFADLSERVTRLEDRQGDLRTFSVAHTDEFREMSDLMRERFAKQDGSLQTLFWMLTMLGIPIALMALEKGLEVVHRRGKND